MPKQSLGNVLIGQSGGPTAVINQSLVGIVEVCRASAKIDRVLGSVHGIQGLLTGRIIDLGRERKQTLEDVARTPSSALRSVRKKPTPEECREILHAIEKLDVHAFFYIGGNDSAETAHLIDEMAREEGWELHLFHVPKTIDNDLRVTDHCPGYGSAAKFVAQAMMGDNEDNRSLPGIKIDVIMGRNAGWLTAASVLARRHEGDGPHLVYVPERDFSLDDFLADVDRTYKRLGRCIVAVSEGIHAKGGAQIVVEGEKDSHGNVQLSGTGALGDFLANEIKRRLGSKLRVRADTFGYLQRCFAGIVSEVDAREAREVGRVAARAALRADVPSGSIAIRRKDQKTYGATYEVIELALVAKNTRPLEERYIRGTNDIAPEFQDYVAPLVGRLPKTAHLSDFPL